MLCQNCAGIGLGIKDATEEVIPAEAGPATAVFPCVWVERERKWLKVPAPLACAPMQSTCAGAQAALRLEVGEGRPTWDEVF